LPTGGGTAKGKTAKLLGREELLQPRIQKEGEGGELLNRHSRADNKNYAIKWGKKGGKAGPGVVS